MKREVEDLGPWAAVGGGTGRLFAPDQDFAIVGGGCEDCAKFRVRLKDRISYKFESRRSRTDVPKPHTILHLRVYVMVH